MIYGFIRLREDQPSLTEQKRIITQFCLKHRMSVDEWIEMDPDVKEPLLQLIKNLFLDDTILVTESTQVLKVRGIRSR